MQTPSPLQLAQFRAHLKKFVEFTDDEWNVVTEKLYYRKLRKKELLVATGKVCTEVCFILNGSFRIFYIKDGIEHSNYFCFQNELISSYSSFLKQGPSAISINAMEDAELLCFSHTSWYALLSDERVAYRMERFGRLLGEYLICCYDDRVLSFLVQSPEERYIYMLDHQPELLQRIPQHYLANYLGITAVSLSRIRKRIFEARANKKMAS
jgi:CRP-like cAMP-binding protein